MTPTERDSLLLLLTDQASTIRCPCMPWATHCLLAHIVIPLFNMESAQGTPPAYTESTSSYDPAEDRLPAYDESHLLPPRPGEPGYATESILTRGLEVPSRSRSFSSGFAYPPFLANYYVSEQQWSQFTQEIVTEAKLSPRRWSIAVGKGLGMLAIGSLMIGFFSTVPAYLVARKTYRDLEHRNLVYATSQLSRKIGKWNEDIFRPRGLLIRVDLPADAVADIRTAKEKEYLKGRVVIILLHG